MEILTYVMAGRLGHKDSMGHTSVLKAGAFQRMSAGTGVTHSEVNDSAKSQVHLYQIWILPERSGLKPSYEESHVESTRRKNEWILIASRSGTGSLMTIHQDVSVYLASIENGFRLDYHLKHRAAWLQVVEGAIEMNGILFEAGDGAGIVGESHLRLSGKAPSEVLFFDLPP